MQIKAISRSLLVILCVVLILSVAISCGGESDNDKGQVLLGPYFAINCPDGFEGNWKDGGVEIRGEPYSIIVEVIEHAGALNGDTDTIQDLLSVIEAELENVERESFKSKDTTGVIITGNADNKKGVALFVPLDGNLITVFTDPRPNTKIDFENAVTTIKTFRLTDPDYFKKESEPEIDDNSNTDNDINDTDESHNSADSSEDGQPKLYSNRFISFAIPTSLELTSDDDRLTILEPKAGISSDTLSLSIQYVDLGDDMKVEEYAQSIADQLSSSLSSMTIGNNRYRVIQSISDKYSEFHLVTEWGESKPLMITVISWTDEIPEDARSAIRSIEIK